MPQSKWKSEAEFQAACVRWFDRAYPDQRGRLMLIYNNAPNVVVGAMLISMGMQPGASDLMYRHANGVHWIELKVLGRKQSDKQLIFEQRVTGWGDTYVCITEDIQLFQNHINKINNG